MKLSSQSQSIIESTIRNAIAKFKNGNEQSDITDIHIQPICASGELLIFDDNDVELASGYINDWQAYEGQDFYKDVERILHMLLNKMKERGEFDNLAIISPYSFVLVDEEKETVTELLLIGDDTLLLNDTLLKDLDEELDNFLKELLNS